MTRREQPTSSQVASIGGRLRRLRRERGLTQSELARQIGIQQSDLSRMEKGEYRVSLDNLFKILSAVGVAVTEFFGEQAGARQPLAQPLGREDMQLLQLLRRLSPDGRREVHEYVEFKLRREATDRRALEARRDQENGR